MTALAAAMPRKAGLPGGGWLSMAPQSDEPPTQMEPPPAHDERQDAAQLAPHSDNVFTSTSSTAASTHLQQPARSLRAAAAPKSSASRAFVPRRAVFELGLSDSAAASPGQTSYYGSSRVSPVFDPRASFAPMPSKWGGASGLAVPKGGGGGESVRPRRAPAKLLEADDEAGSSGAGSSSPWFEYAGQKFCGITAQAVELEMEAKGDRTVMSYAPDAVYLASRLEGLKRNMEAPGFQPPRRWLEFSDDEGEQAQTSADRHGLSGDEEADGAGVAQVDVNVEGDVDDVASDVAEMDGTPESRAGSDADGASEGIERPHISARDAEPRTSDAPKEAGDEHRASVHRLPNGMRMPSHLLASHHELYAGDAQVHGDEHAGVDTASEVASTVRMSTSRRPTTTIDRAAKQAALDSRVEIRQLRRPDLEQVRDLHCLHGDSSEKIELDTYTTSAGFLLRLLVDENHVCLVAVAKPLPEPAPLPPLRAAPTAPPPSLDMPPTESPYLLASRGITSASPYLRGVRRFVPSVPSLADDEMGERDEADADGGAAADGSPDASRTDDGSSSVTTRSDSLFSASPASFPSRSPTETRRAGEGRTRASSSSLLSPARSSSSVHSGGAAASVAGPSRHGAHPGSDADRAMSALTAPTSVSRSPPELNVTTASPDAQPGEAGATREYKPVLAGPMHTVAPPRAVRIMAAPPLGGINLDQETVLGVASANLSIRNPVPTLTLGGDPEAEGASQTRPVLEVHILTLAIAHSERGQGLGSRLLDALLEECRRRAPHIRNSSSRDRHGRRHDPRHMALRFHLESHPSNASAMSLFASRGFGRVRGDRGVKRGFYRGDPRIGLADRLKLGGTDAWVWEKVEAGATGAAQER